MRYGHHFVICIQVKLLGLIRVFLFEGMSSSQERVLIIGYWFRIFIARDFSIVDIAKIIKQFADECEQFDEDLSHEVIKYENSNEIMWVESVKSYEKASAFGTMVATPGRRYHWKIHCLKMDRRTRLHFGIIKADKCDGMTEEYWWCKKFAYSYYRAGTIYSGSIRRIYKDYGSKFEEGDIIDIWLDLKENNDLSFGRNDKHFGKAFDVASDTEYRLAVGTNGRLDFKLNIIDFEIY